MANSIREYFIAGYVLLAAVMVAPSASAGTIVLGGTNAANLALVMTNLGISYVDASGGVPDPTGYGAGDTIIVGMDGGLTTPPDYNAFLNAGGHLVVTGGSGGGGWATWASGYFNLTDLTGWHTDGDWHTTPGSSPLTALMPANYAFEDNNLSYHMLAFLPTPNTTILGTNDEVNSIAAVRTYANGGFFYYLALDPGPYGTPNDIQNFTTPFVQGIFDVTATPEPGTSAAMAGGLILFGLVMRRRRR